MFCVYCGDWLPDAAKFCNQCGKVVKAGNGDSYTFKKMHDAYEHMKSKLSA